MLKFTGEFFFPLPSTLDVTPVSYEHRSQDGSWTGSLNIFFIYRQEPQQPRVQRNGTQKVQDIGARFCSHCACVLCRRIEGRGVHSPLKLIRTSVRKRRVRAKFTVKAHSFFASLQPELQRHCPRQQKHLGTPLPNNSQF